MNFIQEINLNPTCFGNYHIRKAFDGSEITTFFSLFRFWDLDSKKNTW